MNAPINPRSYEHHIGPGRRLATGCTRGDTLMAAFGFFAHAFLFIAVGAGVALADQVFGVGVLIASTIGALSLLALRTYQVGASTTKESIEAIKEAWK